MEIENFEKCREIELKGFVEETVEVRIFCLDIPNEKSSAYFFLLETHLCLMVLLSRNLFLVNSLPWSGFDLEEPQVTP
jgi:hypothetical protein